MKTSQDVRKQIAGYISEVREILSALPIDNINQVVTLLEEARVNGNQVFVFGNGGSAATASHFACDLTKGAIREDKPRIKAYALTDNVHILTAWANDTDYHNVFAEQLECYAEPGDVAIGISGSGNSPNVLNGIEVAARKGATTIGFIGFDGGKMKDIVDVHVIAPIRNMEQSEDIHLILEHIVTFCLREGV